MNLSKFLHRGDSVKSNLRNEPFHRDLTRKPWVYSGNILNLFVLRCMDFSKENISVLSLHRTPKFSASVNISLASPVHCLLIIPISLLPSKELSCGNKISLQKSNTYLNTIQKPLQTWSMDIVTLSPPHRCRISSTLLTGNSTYDPQLQGQHGPLTTMIGCRCASWISNLAFHNVHLQLQNQIMNRKGEG